MTAHVTAALRAVQVVAERTDPTEPMTVGAIARELSIALSRASRLCAELESVGLLERAGPYGSYRLGAGGVRLSGHAAAPFAHAVRSALTMAAQQTGETVLLAAVAGGGMRVIAAVESVWTLHTPADVGDLIDDPATAAMRASVGSADAGSADAGSARLVESAAGTSVEIASPVLAPTGECMAVVAVRFPLIRSDHAAPRGRRAVVAAARSIERVLSDWLGPRPAATAPSAEEPPRAALQAATRILGHLLAGQDSVAGIARATGLRPDRALRLLESCARAGFVISGADASQFQLGWMMHGWHRAAAAPTMVAHGRRLVADSADRTRTCGFITTLKGMRSFTLIEELEMAGEGLRMLPWLGRAHPIVGSDGGPTLLMDFSAEELRVIFPARHTPRELRVFLERVRSVVREGVLTMEAFESGGLLSISAPVRDSSGLVVAAACLVGTTEYMSDHVQEFEEETRRLAADVSAVLQYG